VTHCLAMMHVSIKFQEILKEIGIFDIRPLLMTLTLEVGIYKWHTTYRLVMMYVYTKFHEILKEKGILDLWSLLMTLTLEEPISGTRHTV